MVTYFTAAKAEKVFKEYKLLALAYWEAKPELGPHGWMAGRLPDPENDESSILRTKLLQLYPMANTYAKMLGIIVSGQSYPAPAVGGPVVTVNFLYAAIDPEQGHSRIPKQDAFDRIEIALASATTMRKEFLWKQALNPVWWLIEIVAYILRIPFLILQRAGLPEAVEESIWGHIVKVVFFLVLVLLSVRFGFDLTAKDILRFFK